MALLTTTPISRKRCPLCLAILEIKHVVDGEVSTTTFNGHTSDACTEATLQRIKVLEELHTRDAHALAALNRAVNDLGEALGHWVPLIDAGRRWLAHRAKRKEDLARLRGAMGTSDRMSQHPLWEAEEETASALQKTIDAIEKRLRA